MLLVHSMLIMMMHVINCHHAHEAAITTLPSPIGRNCIAPKGLIILGHDGSRITYPYVLLVYTLQLHAESGHQDLFGILILKGELCFA